MRQQQHIWISRKKHNNVKRFQTSGTGVLDTFNTYFSIIFEIKLKRNNPIKKSTTY